MASDDIPAVEKVPMWRVYMVLVLLILAYCGKYFCTSCIYVAQDLWVPDQNITTVQASYMFVFGYIASMVGKTVAGPWSDIYGGKIVMGVSTAGFLTWITVFSFVPKICESIGVCPEMGLGNYYPEFFFVWVMNGFFALGLSWVAIMAIASNWIPASHTGRLMAILGLAPELGDSWARLYLAPVVSQGWEAVLQSAARFSLLFCIPMFLLVQNSPEEAAAKAAGAVVAKKDDPIPFRTRVKTLFTDSPLITLLMTLCGFLYAIRTMFLLYSVNYLSHALCGLQLAALHGGPIPLADLQDNTNAAVTACIQDNPTVAAVASASAWYTVFGCAGVYLSGILKDKLPKRHRSTILVGNVTILIASLSVMKFYPMNVIPFPLATLTVGMVGFSTFGAYLTSTGAFAVDIGGKKMKATCSALMGFSSNGAAAMIIVCKGYLGNDWDSMFTILIGLGVCGLVCAGAIYSDDLKKIDVPGSKDIKALLLA